MTSASHLLPTDDLLAQGDARSLRFYRDQAQSYFDSTAHLDLAHVRHLLAERLQPGARLMDAGCGSGRDTKAFAAAGFDVYAFDASPELASLASAHSGRPVACHTFEQLSELASPHTFDAVWACSSLVHLTPSGQERALGHLLNCLKPGGWLYTNFKTGATPESTPDGRQFYRVSEAAVREQLARLGLSLQTLWLSGSARSSDVQWLNVLATR